MQLKQLEKGLTSKFEQSHIVFWYDLERSFTELIESINLDDVVVLNMENESTLQVKKWILRDNPEQAYLLYFPYHEPKEEDNWLLDVSFISVQFYADQSTMILNELGIKSMQLRDHIKLRESYFSHQKHIKALKKRITEVEDETSLDTKMIAVLANSEPTLNSILMVLFSQYAQNINEGDKHETALFEALVKFNLAGTFWGLCKSNFNYATNEPSLQSLLYKLFSTDLLIHINVPEEHNLWAKDNILSSSSGRASASAFMLEWRDSKRFSECHDVISALIAKELDIMSRYRGFIPTALQECYSFEVVEQTVIRGLILQLTNDAFDKGQAELTTSDFESIISMRLSGHWCQTRIEYKYIYQALKSAEKLFNLQKKYTDGFHYSNAKEMYQAYADELFLFDYHYRIFNQFADQVQSKGGDVLRKIDEAVERLYVGWYIYELGLAWDKLLEKDSVLTNWSTLSPRPQTSFYNQKVRLPLQNKSLKRMFVVISDAMRYEVAYELMQTINNEKRFKSNLSNMHGVLPSYTKLGMAALLPHQSIEYSEKNQSVLVDGKNTSSTENKNSILESHSGIAITSKQLLAWSQKEGREILKDKSVVYIYHNTIDAIGDDGSTEDKAFEACETAIVEVNDLVKKLINNLNASRVLVTADHGFLYQQQGLTQPEKTGIGKAPEGSLTTNKRYILGRKLPNHDLCWHGAISNTVNTANESDVEFLLPKGANRFHFVSGARFVHGGAMPQEICVPVLDIQMLRGKKATLNEKIKVGLIPEASSIRFVNQIEKVRFIQTNAVGGNYVERKVVAVIKDSEGNAVSSEENLLFDAVSDNMNERTREARFKLIGSDFNRNESYQLVVIDVLTNTVVEQFPRPVIIDLLDRDDFSF